MPFWGRSMEPPPSLGTSSATVQHHHPSWVQFPLPLTRNPAVSWKGGELSTSLSREAGPTGDSRLLALLLFVHLRVSTGGLGPTASVSGPPVWTLLPWVRGWRDSDRPLCV